MASGDDGKPQDARVAPPVPPGGATPTTSLAPDGGSFESFGYIVPRFAGGVRPFARPIVRRRPSPAAVVVSERWCYRHPQGIATPSPLHDYFSCRRDRVARAPTFTVRAGRAVRSEPAGEAWLPFDRASLIRIADGPRALKIRGEAHAVLLDGTWTLVTIVVAPDGISESASLRAGLACRLSALGVELVLREGGRLRWLNAAAREGSRLTSYVRTAHEDGSRRSAAEWHDENMLAVAFPGDRHLDGYSDRGSGMDMGRPGLRALLGDAADGAFTHLVVADLARLSWDISSFLLILRALAHRGVVVLFRS